MNKREGEGVEREERERGQNGRCHTMVGLSVPTLHVLLTIGACKTCVVTCSILSNIQIATFMDSFNKFGGVVITIPLGLLCFLIRYCAVVTESLNMQIVAALHC